MNFRTLALASALGGAACGNALALVTPTTTGLTTTYLETFEDGSSFSAGRVPAGDDDFMWLTSAVPTASFAFTAAAGIAALTLDFWYSVPGDNSGQVSLTGPGSTTVLSTNLADTPGSALLFVGNNPGASTGGFAGVNDADARYTSATFTNLVAGEYTLTFSKVGGLLNSLKVDDVNIAVTAIPEPETYALLLGGLGLMGWVGWRRRPTQD